ncbi:DNRLRE domain-containing protein [Peribacillus sp. NJ4]|uniref:DNRLRE domain-containing protein n=1 Tax=Peribacillus sp. NJ4 TaxID=3055862 RepID=UPI0025A08D14|nr:DNRLRE domain-containing protein [Peribacillus sp. NJ4]MDM5210821.1 DNRLRE domain-containing protein [Peribacillus sp. NJ4]
MLKFRKYIASILILALLCSLLPTYTGASSENTSQTKENEKETINTDNLDEVVKERTESSKTFTDGEGNFVKEIYPEEIHNKVDGKYKTISEELVEKDNKGYIETETTNLEFMFPEKLGEDKPLIYQSGEHKLSFELTYASDGEKQTEPTYTSGSVKEENSITLKSIYPNIDLRHVALNNEVKEDWIMNEYNGINEFHYTIQTDLYGQVEKDGSIGFYENESKEKSIFTLPKPVMVDSNYNDTLGDGVRSTDIHYELNKKSDDSYELVLKASKEWLSSSKRVFPIYIDPSVSIDALGDTFVMSAYPNNNYNKEWDPSQGEYVLKTGYYDSTTGTNYPFVKFSVIGDLKGATIDSAELAAYVTHSYYVDTKTDIWVDEVKAQWYVDELTWNNKPSSTKITSTSVARDQWAYFDVKNTIQAWVDGTRENYGFKFHTNGNGKTHWKKITAAESAKKAKLVISYHYEKMKNPTVSSFSYGEGKADGYIDVKWGSVHGAKSYDLQMYDGKGYQTIYSGTSTSWSTKGKKIFPKAPYSTSSTYKTDSTGVELPVDPSAFYSVKSGTTTTKKDYGFRVVAKFANGDSPASTAIYKAIPVVQVGIPDIPAVKPYAYPETDTVNKGRGWLDISWKPVTNATGYKVLIWNGTKYKEFSVGKVTSVSTKGKKIWPTDADLKNGIKELYPVELDKSTSIGKGTELPIDPSITYGNGSNRYSIRVKAISAAGDSASSDVNYGYIPLYAPKNAKLTSNLEDMVNNKSSLTVKWDATTSAKYYEVQISDDKTTKTYQVKGKTSFTTEPIYGVSSNYSATVKAYYVDDDNAPETEQGKITGNRGLSPASNKGTVSVDPREDLNGLEDYFTYEDHSFGNATASVNVTTGNMVMEFTDQSLFTRGLLGFDFTRYYNSRSTRTSALGQGWTFIGNEKLKILSNKDILYTDEDGTTHIYVYKDAKYVAPNGIYEKLEKQDEQTWTLTNPDGFVQTFKISKDSSNFLIASYTDNYKNQIDFVRNEKDQLITVKEAKGIDKQEKIAISYQDDKISKVQFANHWTTFTYIGDLLVKTTIGNDKTTRTIIENFAYNSHNQLVKYVDGKNNTSEFFYAENELKIFDKQAKDEELSVTNSYQFNVKDNEYKSVATDDAETIYKRDLKNNTYAVSQVTTPSEEDQNSTIFYDLDKNFNVLTVTNPDGTTEKNSYDTNGNVLSSKTTNGTIVNTYNDNNQLVKTVAANGELTTNQFEGPSLVSSTLNDETTTYTYDSFGRLIKTNYPNNTFEKIAYDDDVFKEKVTDKNENTTSVQYTIFGQREEVTDAEGHTTKYTYDPLYFDKLTSVTDGNGYKTEYTYDANNNMTSLIDALGRKKSYEYNYNDQVTKKVMPLMTFQYEYDLNGEMSKETLPSGIQKQYNFNESGNLDTINLLNAQDETAISYQYQYDAFDKLTTLLQDGQSIKAYDYNKESNLLEKYGLGSFVQSYTYDDQERLTKRKTSYQDIFSVQESKTYKENTDDIQKVQYKMGEQVYHSFAYDDNAKNNNQTISVNDDLLKQVSQLNDANRLETLTYTSKAQSPFVIAYDYTKNGNISKETVQNKTTTYAYDQNEQLVKEILSNGQENTYSFDKVGNRLTSNINDKKITFTYNDANQIKTKNDIVYKYDVDGNLIQDENYHYTYNAMQQLTVVEQLDGRKIASYTYDENGLRLTKTVGDTIHEYFYNNEVLDMEVIKQNNQVISFRSYEWNQYNPLGMIVKEKDTTDTWTTKSYQFTTNQRGDVLNIRDESDKEVGSYTYDAYGNILSVEGDIGKENPIRYAGYYFDDETKNYYLQARYYNPANGSFLALDPHPGDDDEPISQNGYTYANNNPVMYVDPNGLYSMRTSVIKSGVDVLVTLIPGLKAINTLLKLRKQKQVHNLLNGKKIKIKIKITSYLTHAGLNRSLAITTAATVVNSLFAVTGWSVGSITVMVLKRYFKAYKKKAKKYINWGPKVNVEYINFSKRK